MEEGSVTLTLEYKDVVKVCEVPLAVEEESTARLLDLLEAAKAESTPAECVTSFSALSPNLPIESINGTSGE